MPRPLVFGNGRLLIAFDRRYAVRDLFFPHVGHPNHLLGHAMRMGVFVDGHLGWCDDEEWARDMRYRPRALVGDTRMLSWRAGVELEATDAVDPERAVYVRRVKLRELRSMARTARLFFTQHLMLGQSDVGNTAFYNGFADAVVHYRGHHFAALTARTAAGGIEQYATGIKDFGGMEGTWRDAEDGLLSGNPIAQGSVDSTFGVSLDLPPGGEAEAWFTLVMGHRLDETLELLDVVRAEGEQAVVDRAVADSDAWLKRDGAAGLERLPEPIQRQFWQSLLLVRTQVDSGGAILAANDSDILATNRATYSYCWPRDGALTAMTLDRINYHDVGERFFAFCDRVLHHGQPFWLQKYRSDGSMGASWHPWVIHGRPEVPFQQDETALVLLAIARRGDRELWEQYWDSTVRPAADFMAEHRDGTGLPLPSWDLWEERRGVHAFTVCCVGAALRAVAAIAEDRGEGDRASRYLAAGQEVMEAFDRDLWDEGLGRFVRMVLTDTGVPVPDRTPDSAILAGLLVADYDPSSPRFASTVAALAKDLEVKTTVGGYARYAGDYYFRRSERAAGNPWVICTLWFAQARLRLDPVAGVAEALRALEWAVHCAEPTGVLPEQLHPETGEHLSVSPLTWSHAEFVHTVLDVLEASRK